MVDGRDIAYSALLKGINVLLEAEAELRRREMQPREDGTAPEPISMILTCPCCGERHVDGPTVKPHKTHACQSCGLLWRPALVHTKGVRFLPGCKDAYTEAEHEETAERICDPGREERTGRPE